MERQAERDAIPGIQRRRRTGLQQRGGLRRVPQRERLLQDLIDLQLAGADREIAAEARRFEPAARLQLCVDVRFAELVADDLEVARIAVDLEFADLELVRAEAAVHRSSGSPPLSSTCSDVTVIRSGDSCSDARMFL